MSSHASSISTTSISHKMRNLAMLGKPVIDISLRGEPGSYVTSFSTMDRLEGEVFITARTTRDSTAWKSLSETYVDNFSTASTISSRTDAIHHFLKLRQPIDESTLPCPRVVKAGQTYRFPFTFVIPEQLLPRACQRFANDQIHAAHLQLPPSIGDVSVSGHAGKLLDDMAPEMARISYAIKVTVTRERESDGKAITLVEKSKKVRVKPAFEEQPPLAVEPSDGEYRLRREKTIRKGVFKGKLGRLVMETQQPRSLCIPGARTLDASPITTSAKVVLRFDPADADCAPPRLGSLSSKLKVTTFYATSPRRNFPLKHHALMDISQGVFSEMLPLASRCVAVAQWERHDAASSSPMAATTPNTTPCASRRDSGVSDCSPPGSANTACPPSHGTQNNSTVPPTPFYTAHLLIPIALPANKTFIPTFHSCLVSRVYRLDLSLSLSATTSLSLKVPLQISAAGSAEGAEERAERLASHVVRLQAEDHGEDVFVPRNIAPPPPPPITARGAPPGYEAFAGMRERAGVESTISVMG